jgi:hypothetical protein
MWIDAIFNKSVALCSEIMVEVQDNAVLFEQLGTKDMVNGFRLNPGSDVYHTHLTDHPPSARDYLTALMCKALYKTRINGVIGPFNIFRFHYHTSLLNEFKLRMKYALTEGESLIDLRHRLMLEKIDRMHAMNLTRSKSDVRISEFLERSRMNCEMRITMEDQFLWIQTFKERLLFINDMYRKTSNDDLYIKELDAIGIVMTIDRRNPPV